jgi:tRNA (mo5U34)-methyltransferase
LPFDKRVSIDRKQLSQCLRTIGLESWDDAVEPLIQRRLTGSGHGDYTRWQETLASLPAASTDVHELQQHLLSLAPWRKGPFEVAGVCIDAEWRSDLKWQRVKDGIEPLEQRNVLDVGSGNGYYALRMRAAGASNVIGIDPTILFVMQFLAVNSLQGQSNVFVLPARLEELPLPERKFDTTFSMGVLYHQRSPLTHLQQLRQTLRPGGQLVLETIYLPGDDAFARTPRDRYARMRNVWLLPSISELQVWLQRSGFANIVVIDQSITTIEEQRTTPWMTFESLKEALEPDDPTRTVEGWPAPHRVLITATSP